MGCFNSKPAPLSEVGPTASEQPVLSRDAKSRVASENDALNILSPDSTPRQFDVSSLLPTSKVEATNQVVSSHRQITNFPVQRPEDPEPPSCDVPSAEDCTQVDLLVPTTTAVAADTTNQKAETFLDKHAASDVNSAEKAKEESSHDAVEGVVMSDVFVMVERDAGGASNLTGVSATMSSLVDTSIPEAGDTQEIMPTTEHHSTKSSESERSATDQVRSSPSPGADLEMEQSSSSGTALLSSTANTHTEDKQNISLTVEHHSERPSERDMNTIDQMPSSPIPIAIFVTRESADSESVPLSSMNSANVSAVDPDKVVSREAILDVVRDTMPSVKRETIILESNIVEDSTETLKEDEKRVSRTLENVFSPVMKSATLQAPPYKPFSASIPGRFAKSSTVDKPSRHQEKKLTWDYWSPYRGGCDEFVLFNPPHGIGFSSFTNCHGNVGTNLGGGAYHYQNIGTDGGFYIKNRDGSIYQYSPYWGGIYSDGYGY